MSTKGTWYPDRTKATERDPPLYLHISATSKEMLQKAIDKVNDLIKMDMGSLVEDKSSRMRERVRILGHRRSAFALTGLQRKWPEEKIPVGIETIRNFNVRAKVVGPSVSSYAICRARASVRSLNCQRRVCLSSTFRRRQVLVCRSRAWVPDSLTRTLAMNTTSQCTST